MTLLENALSISFSRFFVPINPLFLTSHIGLNSFPSSHITTYNLSSANLILISQFIGNFNNFGIFYFLRGGLYSDGYFLASDTDLLINWLYNMSIDNNYYSVGAAISLVIFIVISIVSLTVYVLSPAYKQEETFR